MVKEVTLSRRNEKIINSVRNPWVLGIGLVFVIALSGLIVASVIKINERPTTGWDYAPEYDPASGETIYDYPNTSGAPMPKVKWVGLFDILTHNGVTVPQYKVFQEAIESYSNDKGIDLSRVSYVKDSLYIGESCTYDFDVVLNVDQVLLNVEIDTSNNCMNSEPKIIINRGRQNNEK